MKVLNRPGTCKNQDETSITADMMQCAETRVCIPMSKFNDKAGICDCCVLDKPCPGDETNCSCCHDHSDQDRIQPPGNASCGDPNWPGNTRSIVDAYSKGQTFQCAKTGRCLEGGIPFSSQNDGVCQCCLDHQLKNINKEGKCIDVKTGRIDPTYCSCCDDHSDEEPVYRNDWENFFTCVGVKKRIEKFTDDVIDCDLDCVEIKVKDKCNAMLNATETMKLEQQIESWCKKLQIKNTPHFQCTSGKRSQKKCLLLSEVLDGSAQCIGGEDEDTSKHIECSEATRNFFCGTQSEGCVLVDGKESQVNCRCPANKKCTHLRPKTCEELDSSSAEYFKCPKSSPKRCIPQSQVNDGIKQCDGGEDEK